jgi:anaerobic magnesium-protoporphyrin IX monomethyl ester cyclase
MQTLLINPPYQTITSNWGVGHQVPLGLLMVGGAVRDAGFDVSLLDAEALRLDVEQIADHVRRTAPTVVMTGHAGSTPAHPVCMAMLEAVKKARPETVGVYGGVFPTYHDEIVLRDHPYVDIIVRGEGEATATAVVHALRASYSVKSLDFCEEWCEPAIFVADPGSYGEVRVGADLMWREAGFEAWLLDWLPDD